jgi:hypothetical protein
MRHKSESFRKFKVIRFGTMGTTSPGPDRKE